jgi:hypothetical protein
MKDWQTILLLSLALALSLTQAACSKESAQGSSPSAERESLKALSAHSVPLQPYSLPGYELVDEETLKSGGGLWVSMRYQAAKGATPDPQGLRRQISDALTKERWTPEPRPSRPYVLTKVWETSPSDLYYKHGPGPRDQDHLFYHQAVHISDDGRTVACYYEIGW